MYKPAGFKAQRSVAARIEDVLTYAFVSCFFGLIAVTAVCLLYWLKSAAGIDLMDGHSPMHGLFY